MCGALAVLRVVICLIDVHSRAGLGPAGIHEEEWKEGMGNEQEESISF